MHRFMVEIDEKAYQALYAFACEERRTLNAQASWILEQVLLGRVKDQDARQQLEQPPPVMNQA